MKFDYLENLGAACAAMSEASDGDCRAESPDGSRFIESLGLSPDDVCTLNQVHGKNVVQTPAPNDPWTPVEADALAGPRGARPMSVLIADCVPVFLYDPQTGAAGLAHAGRRGTFENITAETVSKIVEWFGAKPESLHAVIGPSAGPCCYEVSEEISNAFAEKGLPVIGRNLDLWNANSNQLTAAGLATANIQISGVCTICSGRFHSHRARPDGRRNVAVILP